MSNMKTVELINTRIIYSEAAFAGLLLWNLPKHWLGVFMSLNTGSPMLYEANVCCAMTTKPVKAITCIITGGKVPIGSQHRIVW